MSSFRWRDCAVLGLALVGHFGSSDAWAQSTLTFRDGVSPSAGYAGTRDVSLSEAVATDTMSDPNGNYTDGNEQLQGFPVRKVALVRYDLSSIPTNANVTGAELLVTLTNSTTDTYEVYELLRSWDLNQATWRNRSNGNPWSVPGALGSADRGNAVLTSITGPTGAQTLAFNAEGLAAVRRWVANPSQNYGMWIGNLWAEDRAEFGSCGTDPSTSRQGLRVTYNGMTTLFRENVSPTSTYPGCDDGMIVNGPSVSANNHNSLGLRLSGAAGSRMNTLLQFELSSVPAGTLLSTVELELYVHNPSSGTFNLYEGKRAWSEQNANWTLFSTGNTWGTGGAEGTQDRDSTVLGTLTASASGASRVTLNSAGVALVQSWINGTVPNRGFVLSGSTSTDGLVLGDRESAEAAQRPALILTTAAPVTPDAGTPLPDAGTPGVPDAGTQGGTDAGVSNPGVPNGPGSVPSNPTGTPPTGQQPFPNNLADANIGCACGAGSSGGGLLAGLWVAFALWRRARRG